MDRFVAAYRMIVPAPVRRLLSGTRLSQRAYDAHMVDRRSQRRFYDVSPSNTTGGVRINLKGRDRHGVVEPDAFDRVCAELKQSLIEIVSEDTGKPIISKITMTRDLYRGPLAHRFPDLLLEWNKAGPIDRVVSPRIGRLSRSHPRVRTGDHVQKRGAYLALGPGIAPGFSERLAKPIDVAPTIAALLGDGDPRYAGEALADVIAGREPASVAGS
jgi:predicted AlkP superfamily phosphohydrolase/phosphomutase